MWRQLLAFKRAPTVDLRIEGIDVEVRDDRVLIETGYGSAWLSWDEWRDLARRVEHSIQWIASNTPGDVNGRSFTVGS
jgi:hypothetical protein